MYKTQEIFLNNQIKVVVHTKYIKPGFPLIFLNKNKNFFLKTK